MNKLALRLACLLAVVNLSSCAEGGPKSQGPKRYIGSLAEIRGRGELRESPEATPVMLDPVADLYRPLYLGAELRCANGGAVKANLLFGQSLEVNGEKWTRVPEVSAPSEADRLKMAAYQQENAVGAGRARGGPYLPRRALLVGINQYAAPPAAPPDPTLAATRGRARGAFTDLDGCINDVDAMYALLVTKFGFLPQNIVVLTNSHATREAILTTFRRHLVEAAQPGDVSFFFYAGHGSQVTNSLSIESDKMDETIVPTDSWQNVPDVRDKEIRRCFNAALDKGARVTAIFDSCHSGSIARGISAERKARHLSPARRDARDAADHGPIPTERGALVLSAAQSTQSAMETKDGSHGAFTAALIGALQSCRPDEPVDHIFQKVRGAMQADNQAQTPLKECFADRCDGTLFGDVPASGSGRAAIPVLSFRGERQVVLLGGLALGLNPGCELRRQGAQTRNELPRLMVMTTEGPTKATAEIIGDSSQVQVGNFFEVDVWAAPDRASLMVWLPPALSSAAALEALAPELQKIKSSAAWEWVADPTAQDPTHFLEWDGKQWILAGRKGAPASLGDTLSASALERVLKGKRARLFVLLPPPAELAGALGLGAGSANKCVDIASARGRADYLLAGRFEEGGMAYAWVFPNANLSSGNKSSLPVRTDWAPISGTANSTPASAATNLTDKALALAKIKNWLTLPAPEDDGAFPYSLALKSQATGKLVTGGRVFDGESFGVVLFREGKKVSAPPGRRHVYAFLLDSDGTSQLVYRSPGDVDDRLPAADALQQAEIELLKSDGITVQAPYGTDTYILLATSEPLSSPDVLSFKGVRSRPRGAQAARGDRNGLEWLVNDVMQQSRGGVVKTPADWCIKRMSVESCKR